MSTSPAKNWFGAVVAALTLTMVASVAPFAVWTSVRQGGPIAIAAGG